jgi:hypothetical protein
MGAGSDRGVGQGEFIIWDKKKREENNCSFFFLNGF